jgi:hypothetical protein
VARYEVVVDGTRTIYRGSDRAVAAALYDEHTGRRHRHTVLMRDGAVTNVHYGNARRLVVGTRKASRKTKVLKWYSAWQTVPRTTLPVYAVYMQSRVGIAAFTRWIVAPSMKVALAAARQNFDDAHIVSIHREDIRWGEGRYPTGRVKHTRPR